MNPLLLKKVSSRQATSRVLPMCFFSPWNKSEYRRTIRNRAQQLNKTSFHMVTE